MARGLFKFNLLIFLSFQSFESYAHCNKELRGSTPVDSQYEIFQRPLKIKIVCFHGVTISNIACQTMSDVLSKRGLGPFIKLEFGSRAPRAHLEDYSPPENLEDLILSFHGYDYVIDMIDTSYSPVVERTNRLLQTMEGRATLAQQLIRLGQTELAEGLFEDQMFQAPLLPIFFHGPSYGPPMSDETFEKILNEILEIESSKS